MSDSLPTVIRVGGVDFTVVERRDLRDGNTGLNGHILYNDCEIRIEQEMTPHKKWITVWHEVLHGLLEQAGMDDHEEKIIVALGYGVTQALRDNPWLRQPPGENPWHGLVESISITLGEVQS